MGSSAGELTASHIVALWISALAGTLRGQCRGTSVGGQEEEMATTRERKIAARRIL